MPWPSERKRKSREKILESAVKLFSSHGFDGVSIGAVMQDAQLTHGGFYTHFDSKQALYAEAVTTAAQASVREKLPDEPATGTSLLAQLLESYLDLAHVRQQRSPCPLAFLATDIANREADVRNAYTRVYKRLVAFMRRQLSSDTPDGRQKAFALSALMIGGVAISRALDDERTVQALLEACKSFGEELISGDFD